MKVIVLGGGVIGVTTAHYLAEAGHEVVVVERQPGVGLETSFANAGQVSPGYSAPWAAPGIPIKAVKWLMMHRSPLVIRPLLDWNMLRWVTGLLGNCTAARYAVNKERMVRLAEYSRDLLGELREATGVQYDGRALGTLQLFRTGKQVEAAAKDIAVLREAGVAFEELDADGCVRVEPGLARARDRIAGGLRLPGDETGDCHLFTQRLAAAAAARGVTFLNDRSITGLATDRGVVTGVETSGGVVRGDVYVAALGSYTPLLTRPLGIDLPVYPVKGYSITAPVLDEGAAPISTVMDETFKVASTRLGDRVRVGGTAELCGFDLTLRAARRETLTHSVGDLFPGGADLSKAEFWCGLRPMTPDGTPIVGPTRFPNLFLNTGHGTLGWTMACGSGKVLADMIGGRECDIDTDGLTLARYG